MNAYGSLTVICGPMFASKTTSVLRQVLWARGGQGRDVLVMKPAFDNRYAEGEIVSHDGLTVPAHSITSLPERAWDFEPTQTKFGGGLIVLDEVQFFCEPYVSGDVEAWVRARLCEGHDVVAAGLDMDWQGQPFAVTASLLAMADDVVKGSAHCSVCGRTARKTYKKVADGDSVELGSGDKYEARCNQHWMER
jgi:thymidine kinase